MADIFRDYLYISDENGRVIMEDDMLLLENLITGEIIKVPYSEAADYYNLKPNTLFEITDVPDIENIAPNRTDSNKASTLQWMPSNMTENENGEIDDPGVKNSKSLKWGIGETKCMLELYSRFVNCIGPLKKFRTKKLMWAYIAIDLTRIFKINFSGLQVETRYKCVIKRTKKTIDNNNNTSGAVRMETDYDEEIHNIVNSDDSLCPEFLLSPGKILKKSSMFPSKAPNLHGLTAKPLIEQAITMPSLSQNFSTHNLSITQQSTSESSTAESSTAESSTAESSTPASPTQETSETAPISNNETPRRRQRKTVQEQLFDKFLNLQTLKIQRQDELIKEKEMRKLERNKEKCKQQQKRHEEKMEVLRAILKAQQKNSSNQ